MYMYIYFAYHYLKLYMYIAINTYLINYYLSHPQEHQFSEVFVFHIPIPRGSMWDIADTQRVFVE